jgi:hypothetical protein
MKVWEDLTTATFVVEASGDPVGWQVEQRKQASTHPFLSDPQVEKAARGMRRIRPDMKLTGIERVEADKDHRFAMAHFAGRERDARFDVAVNHTTGDIIGVLPVPQGKTTPIAGDHEDARKAMELAWRQVKEDLTHRVGLDVAQEAREVMNLTLLKGTRDELGRQFYEYRLWAFYTTADVSVEEKSKQVVTWTVEAFQADAPQCRLLDATAQELAAPELKAVKGVQGPQVSFGQADGQEKATVHWWHMEDGINIEGDQTTVLLNAWDGTVFSVARKWRDIPPALLKAPGITAEQALQAADQAAHRPPTATPGKILGRSVIEVAKDPDQPGPVRDVLVWRVGYSDPSSPEFTELAIDHQTGQVVRVTGW